MRILKDFELETAYLLTSSHTAIPVAILEQVKIQLAAVNALILGGTQ